MGDLTMVVAERVINSIASPLSGWVVTDGEAKGALNKLMSLDDASFVQACRALSRHAWNGGVRVNRIKMLLNNLSSSDRDRMYERIITTAAAAVLPSLPSPGEAPYATYVKKTHALVREMGLGKNGALQLLDAVIAGTTAEKVAPHLFLPLESVLGRVRRRLRTEYQAHFGTDNLTGWDKVMHFVKSAQLAFNYGRTASINAGVAKETYDEIEQLQGKDPEGWSWPDIDADVAGADWGEALRSQP